MKSAISRTQYQQAMVARATAAREWMMRLRSSSRCCNRLIEPSCRSSCFCSSGSATSSGIVVLRDAVFDALGEAVQSAAERDVVGTVYNLVDLADRRLQVLFDVSLDLQLADFVLDLVLEGAAGFPEFGHELPHLPCDLRQSPRPKKDEGQEHDEYDLARKTKVHKRCLIKTLRSFGCVGRQGLKPNQPSR